MLLLDVVKVILKTFLGLLISAVGFCLGFLYLIEMEQGYSPLLLAFGAFLVVLGAYFLIRAGKSDVTVIKKPDVPLTSKDASNAELEAVFDKNNKLSSQWAKTVEKRDRLKLLEISAAAEDEEQ